MILLISNLIDRWIRQFARQITEHRRYALWCVIYATVRWEYHYKTVECIQYEMSELFVWQKGWFPILLNLVNTRSNSNLFKSSKIHFPTNFRSRKVRSKMLNVTFYSVSNSPSWFFKNNIADLKIVDLSIFRVFAATILASSFTNMLNWSRLFFSLRFRNFLQLKLMFLKFLKWPTVKMIIEMTGDGNCSLCLSSN